jgi:hypothetical protein
LETGWLAELKLSYPVQINDEVFKSLLPNQ